MIRSEVLEWRRCLSILAPTFTTLFRSSSGLPQLVPSSVALMNTVVIDHGNGFGRFLFLVSVDGRACDRSAQLGVTSSRPVLISCWWFTSLAGSRRLLDSTASVSNSKRLLDWVDGSLIKQGMHSAASPGSRTPRATAGLSVSRPR